MNSMDTNNPNNPDNQAKSVDPATFRRVGTPSNTQNLVKTAVEGEGEGTLVGRLATTLVKGALADVKMEAEKLELAKSMQRYEVGGPKEDNGWVGGSGSEGKVLKNVTMMDFFAPKQAKTTNSGADGALDEEDIVEEQLERARGAAFDQTSWTLREERRKLKELLDKVESGEMEVGEEDVKLVKIRLGVLESELAELAKLAVVEGHLEEKAERNRLLAIGGIGCQVCGHPDRLKIDAALVEQRYTTGQVGRLFGIKRKHLEEHWERHLVPIVEYSVALQRVTRGLKEIGDTVGRLDHVAELGERALETAVSVGKDGLRDVPAILNSLRENLELRAKLRGEMGLDGTISIPGGGGIGQGIGVGIGGRKMAVLMVPNKRPVPIPEVPKGEATGTDNISLLAPPDTSVQVSGTQSSPEVGGNEEGPSQ